MDTKRIVAILTALICSVSVQAATVTFDLTNFVQGVSLPTNTTALVTLSRPTATGSGLVIGNPTRITVNGSANLAESVYDLKVNNEAWPSSLRFYVPPSGSYRLSELVTNALPALTNAPYVTSITAADGSVAVTPTTGRGHVDISVSVNGVLLLDDGTNDGGALLLDE